MKINNVELPVEFNERFIPPELEEIFDFYPEFLKRSSNKMSFQGYMSLILKELDRVKPNGFNGHDAFQALVSHHGGGTDWFMKRYREFAFAETILWEGLKMKRFCDEDCNNCQLLISNNSRQLTYILNQIFKKFGDEAYKIIQDNCPNLTVCKDCHIDDFCHTENCELAK